MSVQWCVVDHNGCHEFGDAALVKLEMALQSNTPRVALDASEIGYDLDLDLEQMTCLQNPNVHLHRRQSPHLDDKWCIYSDPYDAEGAWHELHHESSADLLSIAQDAGFSTMTYEYDGYHYRVDLKKMRVRRSGSDGRDEKYILRVQPPLEVQDDDDSTTPLCPISQMPLVEPVVAADGHTYEKRQLQRWLAKKCTSPMTNEPMVPWMARNFALETLVNKKRAADDAPTSEKKRPRAAPGASAPCVDSDEGEIVGE